MSKVKLTATCNITTGKLDSNAAVENGAYLYFTCAPEPLRIDTYAFDDDVILLAGNNASGNFHCQRYKGKFNAYQRTYIITAKEGYDIDYVYYNLLINLQLLKKHSQGSSTKFLTMSILDNFEIEDIPIEKQQLLIGGLKSIDLKIVLNNSICSDLESMAKLLYDYWFVQFDFPDENGRPYKSSGGKMVWNDKLKREIPEGWEFMYLNGQYKIDRGVSYTTNDIKSGNGLAMINLACVDINRNYKDGELKYYGGKNAEKAKASSCDMLIACTDLTRNRAIIGCPVLVPTDGIEYVYSMDMAKISFTSSKLKDMYMYMTLRTDCYHEYIKKWASGTNVLHLDLTGLDWYGISVPPIDLQKRFSEIILDVHLKKSNLMSENRELVALRDFLLPMLMNRQIKIENVKAL